MSNNSTPAQSARKSFKTVERKLYLTSAQEATLETWRRECCRIYNRALEHRIKAYKRRKESVSQYGQQKLLTLWRRGMPTVAEVPAQFERDALRRVDRGFKAFWRRLQTKAERPGFPRFRTQHRYMSMEQIQPGNFFRSGKVFVPGIGLVRSRGCYANGKQKGLRLIKRADAWYAQVIVEGEPLPPKIKPQSAVGIDMGLTSFATLSTGEKIDNPRWARAAARRLKLAQRRLSRKQRGSCNRVKARRRVARVHQRVAAQRKDFAHQFSRRIVDEYDLIGFEKLNIAGLGRSRLAKSIMDAAWGLFLFFVMHKAENAGRHAVPVTAAGTSQECPQCGRIAPKSLSERVHACTCGLQIDRDEAAARVILARALAVAGALRLLRGPPLLDGSRHPASGPDETGSFAAATQQQDTTEKRRS